MIGFPFLMLYLAWMSYSACLHSTWFPNYVAQFQSFMNAKRHMRKESTFLFRQKIKALVALQDLVRGLQNDLKGLIMVVMMSESKQKSKWELKQIKLKKEKREAEENAWIDKQPLVRKRIKAFALGTTFTLYIYAMIFANLYTMGHERGVIVVDDLMMWNGTNPVTNEPYSKITNEPLLERINNFFALVFIVEFLLKVSGMGIKFYFRDHFNKFDFLLVSFSLFEIFVMPYLDLESGGGAGGARSLKMVRMAKLLRMAKLGKVARSAIRAIKKHMKKVEVMYNADDYNDYEWRRKLKKFCIRTAVTNFIYVLIVVNLATVILDSDIRELLYAGNDIMFFSDRVFAVLFTIEMLMKWLGLGLKLYFMDPFENLNFWLVSLGWLEIALLPAVRGPSEAYLNRVAAARATATAIINTTARALTAVAPDSPVSRFLQDAAESVAATSTSAEGEGGSSSVGYLKFLRFARFARFARVLKFFKPQTQSQWRFQKSLEFKIIKMNKKFSASCEEYLSTLKSFCVDHELVITKWDSLLDSGTAVYLFRPFKHHLRYWKLVTFAEILAVSTASVWLKRGHTPAEQLLAIFLILAIFQFLHIIALPYMVSRERKMDSFCRLVNMWNCFIGITIASDRMSALFGGVLLVWGNLAILGAFGTLMQVPQFIRLLLKSMRSWVDSGVVNFIFSQIERKSLALEFSHTGLAALQQWDHLLQDQKWNGIIGFSTKTRPTNLLSNSERASIVRWAAMRNLKLINIRDSSGVSCLHEAMAKAEPEVCKWLVHHDRDFVDLEDSGRDTPLLIGLKELARALLSFSKEPSEEASWRRARYSDIFLSEQVQKSEPTWNRFHYATLNDIAVPRLGELTQQLSSVFDLAPPEGYVRISQWPRYGESIMNFLAEMYVASRTHLNLRNKELGDIGFDALLAMNSAMQNKFTTFTVPTNFQLHYTINVLHMDISCNRLAHEAGMSLAEMLATNQTLTSLDLSDNSIDDEAGTHMMTSLRHNHSLKTLLISGNLLGPACGKELAHCLRRNNVLSTVDVSHNSMGPKRFWKDHLTEERVEGSGYDLGMSLRHNKTLTNFNLANNRLGENTGDGFAQMMRKNQTLLTLNLKTNEILSDGGRYISNSLSKKNALTYLNISDNQLGPKAGMALARALKDNYMLAHLDVSTNRLGYKAGQAFAIAMMHNTSLVSIDLTNNAFGPNVGKKWASAIARNSGLTDLNFSGNDLGKESHLGGNTDELGVMLRKSFVMNQTLTRLNLSKCHFDSVTFIALAGSFVQMKALKSLNLDYLVLDEPCTLQLCNALDSFPLINLSLANCEIGESKKSANLLAEALCHSQALTALDISNNKLGDRCCETLASFLKGESVVIRHLNLAGNDFGSEGGMEISSALSHCHSLTWLDVSNNDLNEDCGCEIAESLREIISFGVVKRRTAIRHLNVSDNPLGGLAATEIIKSFFNEVTRYIGLSNTGLDPVCGQTLGEGLRRATIAWEVLDLSKNSLGKDGANHVWWAMRKNNSILELDMSYNEIGGKFGTSEVSG